MGIVYLAHDPHVRRRVAVKTFLLPPGLTSQQEREYSARFLREAQAAGSLSHPSIVTIFDADTDPERGLPFIVMEFVEGGSLRDLMIRDRRLEPDRALAMASSLADALRVAHEEGIVHRDIKPANVLLRARDGQAKIVDFGVARMSTSELTGAGDVFGSPAYMSPEQFRGAAVDARSDLFSLGTILYQTLCGERPFAGDEMSSLAYSVVHMPVPSIAERLPGSPHEVDRFFDKALAKDPEDRFADAGAFRDAVDELRRAFAQQSTIALSAHDARRVFALPPLAVSVASIGQSARATMDRIRRAMAAPSGVKHYENAMPAMASGTGQSGISALEGLFAVTMLVLAILPGLWALWSPASPQASALGLTAMSEAARGNTGDADTAVAGRTAPSSADRGSRARSRSRSKTASSRPGTSPSSASRKTLRTVSPGTSAAPKSAAARSATRSGTPGSDAVHVRTGEPPKVSTPATDPTAASPDETTLASLAAPMSREPPARPPEVPRPIGILLIDARSLVKQGTIKVLVDGREVYHRRLSSLEGEGAQPKKLFRRREETFTVRVEVAPGSHTVAAQVFSEGRDAGREDSTEVRVSARETAHLHLVAGRILGSSISLKAD